MLAMSFLTANFKWILLAVVLFAMLIVGYVADKTDFGHKKTSKKKEIENPNKVEELDLDNLKGKTLSDMVGGSNEATETNDINEDLNAPFGDAVNTNEDINNMDALYAPIGEDLNAPLGDTTTESINEDILTAPIETTEEPKNEDFFTPISEEVTETPAENVDVPSADFSFEPIKEETESLDEVMPEVKIENMPESDDILTPVETIEDTVLDNPVQSEEVPVVESPVETIDIPAESDEIVIPTSEELEVPAAMNQVETIDVPIDTPIVEEVVSESTDEEKPKKKKKNKKSKEDEIEKYDNMDYEQEIVPEVITEKFNDGNNEEIASDDDIWKF
nr:hypothetical protein [Bacilli bacterium]